MIKINNLNRAIEKNAGWIFVSFGTLILTVLGSCVVIGWKFLDRILNTAETSARDFRTTVELVKTLWFYLCPSLAILLICSGILLLKKKPQS